MHYLTLAQSSTSALPPSQVSLHFEPLMPMAVLVVLGIVLIALGISVAKAPARAWSITRLRISQLSRTLTLAILRIGGIASLLILLANPVYVDNSHTEPRRPDINIYVDTSASMGVPDVEVAGKGAMMQSRLCAIEQTWLNDPAVMKELARIGSAHWWTIGDTGQPQPAASQSLLHANPTGQSSQLTRAMHTVLLGEGVNLDASSQDNRPIAILLSDGRDTTGQSLRTLIPQVILAARDSHRVPTLYAGVVGTTRQKRDLAVRITADHTYVFSGESANLNIAVDQVGLTGEQTQVVISCNGTVIERHPMTLSTDTTSFTTSVRPWMLPPTGAGEGGEHSPQPDQLVGLADLSAEIEPLPGESLTENNERHTFVQVTRQHVKVVIFENEPYWDTRYLIRTLEDDPQIELTTVTGLGRKEDVTRYDPDLFADNSGVNQSQPLFGESGLFPPLSVDELSAFDVVILGRGCERWFGGDKAQNLVDYVIRRGGQLILARGEPFSDTTDSGREALRILDPISPVAWGQGTIAGGRLQPTAQAAQVSDSLQFNALGGTQHVLINMPEMIADSIIDHEKTASIVWVRDQGAGAGKAASDHALAPAAIVHQQIGRGRVLAILADGMWRWAMLPTSQRRYDSVYHLFWSRTMRWLVGGQEFLPGQSISMTLSRMTVEPHQPIDLRIRTRFIDLNKVKPVVTLIDPLGGQQIVALTENLGPTSTGQAGLFTATLAPETEGLYDVVLHAPGAQPDEQYLRFAVYGQTREMLDPSIDPGPMIALAQSTPGVGKAIDALHPLPFLNDLEGMLIAGASDPIIMSAWPTWRMLSLCIGCFAIEWLIRRWCAMM